MLVLHLHHLPVAVPQPVQHRHALREGGHYPGADCGRPLGIQERAGIQRWGGLVPVQVACRRGEQAHPDSVRRGELVRQHPFAAVRRAHALRQINGHVQHVSFLRQAQPIQAGIGGGTAARLGVVTIFGR